MHFEDTFWMHNEFHFVLPFSFSPGLGWIPGLSCLYPLGKGERGLPRLGKGSTSPSQLETGTALRIALVLVLWIFEIAISSCWEVLAYLPGRVKRGWTGEVSYK